MDDSFVYFVRFSISQSCEQFERESEMVQSRNAVDTCDADMSNGVKGSKREFDTVNADIVEDSKEAKTMQFSTGSDEIFAFSFGIKLFLSSYNFSVLS